MDGENGRKNNTQTQDTQIKEVKGERGKIYQRKLVFFPLYLDNSLCEGFGPTIQCKNTEREFPIYLTCAI